MEIKKRQEILTKAFEKFSESLNFPSDEIHRESLIKRFEYTFELSWKLMQDVLRDQGHESYGVKTIIRNAGKIKLINNVDDWINYANARNNASHIYLEKVAIDVENVARNSFDKSVKELLSKVSEIY